MIKRKLIVVILCVSMIIPFFPDIFNEGITAEAATGDLVETGYCGEATEDDPDGTNIVWTVYENGKFTASQPYYRLVISGSGRMNDYYSDSYQPWYDYSAYINDLVISGDITYIGIRAFSGCSRIVSEFSIPDSVEEIGHYAFADCSRMTGTLDLPEGLQSIGTDAFLSCTKLTGDILIPDYVTSIGKEAFYKCSGFDGTLVLPEGLYEIPDYAFAECSGLTGDIVIPKGIESIGYGAFAECSGFDGELILPESLRYIYDGAFALCSGLQGDLVIPAETGWIGNYAFSCCSGFGNLKFEGGTAYFIQKGVFYGCSGLAGKAILPDDLIYDLSRYEVISSASGSFTQELFMDCSELTSIWFSDSTEDKSYEYYQSYSIEEKACYNCTSLTNIWIPDTVVSIAENAFACDSGKTIPLTDIYYEGSEEEWAAIEIDPSNEALLKDTVNIHYNYPKDYLVNGVVYKVDKLDGNQCVVAVKNRDGNALRNASVQVSGMEPVQTDRYGYAVISIDLTDQTVDTFEELEFSVTHGDYLEQTGTIEWEDLGKYVPVVMLRDGEELKLRFAKYYDTSALYSENLKGKDILAKVCRLNRKSGKASLITIKCGAYTEESVTYTLYQGSEAIASSADGVFEDLTFSKFEDGGNVHVRVFRSDGKYSDTYLNLIFETVETSTGSLSFGSKNSFTVPGDIPFIGGMEMNFDFPILPVTFQYVGERDKIQVGVNVEFSEDPNTAADQIDDLRKTVKQLNKLKSGGYPGNDLQKQINSLTKSKNKEGAFGPVKVSVEIIGYGEGTPDGKGNWNVKISGGIYLKASVTYQGPTVVVGVVPFTYSVKVTGKVGIVLDVEYDCEKDYWSGDLLMPASLKLAPFIGVGVGDLVGAGIYGEAEIDTEVQLMSAVISPGLNKADLTAELGIKGYIGPLEASLTFAKATYPLYERGKLLSYGSSGSSGEIYSGEEFYAAGGRGVLFDESAYALQDTSYLSEKEETGFGASAPAAGGIAVKETDTAGLPARTEANGDSSGGFMPLISNSYRNSGPLLAKAGSLLVMVYMDADTERSAADAPILKYSVYSNGVWSDPLPVNDDGTADIDYAFASDGQNAWLVYTSEAAGFGDGAELSLQDIGTGSEVYAAKFSSETGAFGESVLISSASSGEDRIIRMPVISVIDGVPVAAWVENSDTGSYFGTNSTNSIMVSGYVDNAWASGNEAVSGLNAVTCMALGADGSTAVLAAVTDGDNDLATDDDRTLYTAEADGISGAVEEAAYGRILYAEYAVLPGESGEELLYGTGEGIFSISDEDAVVSSGEAGAGFTVLSDGIIYRGIDGTVSDEEAASSDTEEGSVYTNIWKIAYIEGEGWASPVRLTDQTRYIQSYDAEVTEDGLIIAAPLVSAAIADGDGGEAAVADPCDLCWILIAEDTHEITVDSAYADPDGAVPGEDLSVTVEFTNAGTAVLDQVTFVITDDEGSTLASQSFDNLGLLPGEQGSAEIIMPVGDLTGPVSYTVEAVLDLEKDNSDNTADFVIGYSGLEIYSEFIRVGSRSSAVVTVTNAGLVSTGGELRIYFGEEICNTVRISELAPGEMSVFEIEVNENTLGGASDGVLEAVVVPDIEGGDEISNRDSVYVTLEGEEEADEPSPVLVSEITVDAENASYNEGLITVPAGGALRMTAEAGPDSADNKNIIWSLEDYHDDTYDIDRAAIDPETGVLTTYSAGRVTVVASSEDGGCVARRSVMILFQDMTNSSSPFYKGVYWAVDEGITYGVQDKSGYFLIFGEERTCTRAQMVTFLWRLAGEPEPTGNSDITFTDVTEKDANKYYYKPVLWAAEKGITVGTQQKDGTYLFKPQDPCLRRQAVMFLWRMAGKPKEEWTVDPFDDVPYNDGKNIWYEPVMWAAQNNITTGVVGAGSRVFNEGGLCLRRQMVTFLWRYANPGWDQE
ncbi:MAG: leucine-rich repeat protein [Lachnospiraceae bacterium]|nr:leucine-rich repeat protein [Lachnospiraceae bacterium]